MKHIAFATLTHLLASTTTAYAQPSPDEVIGYAARGQVEAVESALEAGADPNGLGEPYHNFFYDQSTPLFEAIEGDHPQAVELLLEAGASVSMPDEDGHSPLWHAAGVGNVEVGRLLLEYGAPIEVGTQDGGTPLAWAARADHTAFVDLLLNEGANMNALDSGGRGIMSSAVNTFGKLFGNGRTVQFLIDKGADVNHADHRGFTPLQWAIGNSAGALLVTHLLIEAGANPNEATNDGRPFVEFAEERGTPKLHAYLQSDPAARAQAEFLQAVLNNDADGLNDAIANGADPNWGRQTETDGGFGDGTALHFATYLGHDHLIANLVELSADPQGADDYGYTALCRAAENSDLETVRALLNAGADPEGGERRAFLGMVPIHFAAIGGNAEVVRTLMEAGAEIDYTTNASMGYGYNTLGFAIHHGNLEVVRLLLDNGADPNALGETTVVPIDLANERGWTAIATLLGEYGGLSGAEANNAYVDEELAAGTPPDDLFCEAAGLDSHSLIEVLTERGYSPPSSAFGCAVSGEMAERLLELGADPNGQTSSGTPLHDVVMFSMGGTFEVLGVLLEAGANPNVLNSDGQSSLHEAVLNGADEIAYALIDGGADVNLRNGEDKTPLQLAREEGLGSITDMLVELGATE